MLFITHSLFTVRTHLNGSLSHDLAQLGNVIILLNGSSEVTVILRLGGVRLVAKSALEMGRSFVHCNIVTTL